MDSEKKSKRPKLSLKRKGEILDALASAAMERIDISEVIKSYDVGGECWQPIFENATNSDEVLIFQEAMDSAKIMDDEMDLLMEPFIARELQKALSNNSLVKKLTIQW